MPNWRFPKFLGIPLGPPPTLEDCCDGPIYAEAAPLHHLNDATEEWDDAVWGRTESHKTINQYERHDTKKKKE